MRYASLFEAGIELSSTAEGPADTGEEDQSVPEAEQEELIPQAMALFQTSAAQQPADGLSAEDELRARGRADTNEYVFRTHVSKHSFAHRPYQRFLFRTKGICFRVIITAQDAL